MFLVILKFTLNTNNGWPRKTSAYNEKPNVYIFKAQVCLFLVIIEQTINFMFLVAKVIQATVVLALIPALALVVKSAFSASVIVRPADPEKKEIQVVSN